MPALCPLVCFLIFYSVLTNTRIGIPPDYTGPQATPLKVSPISGTEMCILIEITVLRGRYDIATRQVVGSASTFFPAPALRAIARYLAATGGIDEFRQRGKVNTSALT